ncbi:MAG: haloacid dehalogenase-like hydrolase [Halobacteriales archaeon]|nr:haloacid dehalogenase-like hydrolase [Halobacteriales archaeon]
MPRRLCTIDLDGTLIRTTVFRALADGLGLGAKVAAWDAEHEAGRMSLEDNFWAELALFEGTPLAEAQRHVRAGPWLAGIPEAVEELRGLGLRVGMLTDQPRLLAELAGPFDPVLATDGGAERGKLTRQVEARFDKLANLRAWCKPERIELQDCIHCGNGTNDIPVFERVGLAVAVNPSSAEVARRADVVLEGVTDLRQVSAAVAQAMEEP